MAHADDSPASTPNEHDQPDQIPSPAADPSPPDESAPTPDAPPEPPASAGLGGLVVTAVTVLACGLGIAFLIERYLASPREPNSGTAEVATNPATAGTSVVKSSETRDLADRLDKLSRQIEAIQKQLDRQGGRSGPPPEVSALQVRVADLTASTNNLTPLLSKFDHLDNRVNELSGSLNSLRGELTSFQSASVATPPRESQPQPRPGTTPTPLPDARPLSVARPAPGLADPKALSGVADLYRRARYKEAREAVNPLTINSPTDARVWYYAALSFGFTTKDWTVGAAQLVQKGITREDAGTPRTAEIDTEFKDLTRANGKDWLAGYRKRVAAKKRGS